jgi:hypothetical protein
MSGGSKAPTNTTSTVTQTTIPEWLKGPTLDVVGKAQALANRPYQAYEADRVATVDPSQAQARSGISGLQNPEQYGQAQQALQSGTNYRPEMFGAAQAQQYMNPYAQNVIDSAVRNAQQEAARQSALAGLQSTKMGGTSGSANAIMQGAIAQRMPQTIGDITAREMSNAYQNAQQQFQRDRAAREYAANLQQTSGVNLSNLGTQIQRSDLERLGALERAGSLNQAQRQLELDTAYQDYLRQQDWEREQVGWLSDIIGQRSPALGSSAISYAPPPSFANQAIGAGLAGLGAYNAFRGGNS